MLLKKCFYFKLFTFALFLITYIWINSFYDRLRCSESTLNRRLLSSRDHHHIRLTGVPVILLDQQAVTTTLLYFVWFCRTMATWTVEAVWLHTPMRSNGRNSRVHSSKCTGNFTLHWQPLVAVKALLRVFSGDFVASYSPFVFVSVGETIGKINKTVLWIALVIPTTINHEMIFISGVRYGTANCRVPVGASVHKLLCGAIYERLVIGHVTSEALGVPRRMQNASREQRSLSVFVL